MLETPITVGNVSFYNETLGRPIYPTPILGVLGLMEDGECAVDSAFKSEGDAIVLVDGGPARASQYEGEDKLEFLSSEYAKAIHGVVAGRPPAIDLDREKRLIECLVKLASAKAIVSAHDVSDGGLAVTLAESCFNSGGLSADVDLSATASPDEAAESALFAERGARVVVSLPGASLARLEAIAVGCGVRATRIGAVSRGEFRIQYKGAPVVRASIDSLRRAWAGLLEKAIEATA